MANGLGALGKYLIVIGLVLAGVGVAIILAGRLPWLRFGRLPGDIYIERPGWRFYFPLATCIILSIIVSFILWLIGRR